MDNLPGRISDEEHLDELLSRPGREVIEVFHRLDGDIIFLGIAGKIGPSLAHMASRAVAEAGIKKHIIGVSKFSTGCKSDFESYGIKILKGDLLEQGFVQSLPIVKNVFFLAGIKFGSEENLSQTWAINTYMPALIANHFKNSRIVAFSTGCVYPMVTVGSGGSKETDTPLPTGEYAQSCLGRERMFEYGSKKFGTEVVIIRLNYAVELRYGVLVDIALKVFNNQPIDLSMGYFNVIWQGDANDFVLRSIELCHSPTKILNITGKEILSVRKVARDFGKLMGKDPIFAGDEDGTALLNDSSEAFKYFGNPKIPVLKIIKWITAWICENRRLLNKPTHYEVKNGRF